AAFHILGLAEKIWNAFAPDSTARSTDVHTPPAVPTCTPIRFFSPAISQAYPNFVGAMLFATASTSRSFNSKRPKGSTKMPIEQNLKNHHRFDPWIHFFVFPV